MTSQWSSKVGVVSLPSLKASFLTFGTLTIFISCVSLPVVTLTASSTHQSTTTPSTAILLHWKPQSGALSNCVPNRTAPRCNNQANPDGDACLKPTTDCRLHQEQFGKKSIVADGKSLHGENFDEDPNDDATHLH